MKNIGLENKIKKYLLAFLLLTSCNGPTYKIPADDYKLVPYNGYEVLVFKSNKGDTDTIFLQGSRKFVSPDNQWSFPIKHIEHFVVLSKRSDAYSNSGKNSYLDSLSLITLFNDGTTKIRIEFSAKHADLYSNQTFTKQDFLHLTDTTLEIDGKRNNDVLIIKADEIVKDSIGGKSIERPNTITKLYWSKQQGIVRYDKLDGEYWRLIKKTTSIR